jgi:four helix bundle protein
MSAVRWHQTCAIWGMHNPNDTLVLRPFLSVTILEHALLVASLARPLVEAIQRKDRDLASQVRRAVSSIALNAAEGRGAVAGNSRLRFETALGSLYEAQAGIRLAVAWGYVAQASADELLACMDRLGGRVYGLVRR